MAKKTHRKMTLQEQEEWHDLYRFVRFEVMNYDENQALSTPMILRLKGLAVNKFMANNNIESTANYSFKVILNTFKYCMPKIKNAINTRVFQDEMHKFNYILKIVESNINTIYVRMKEKEKVEENIAQQDVSEVLDYINTFKAQQKKTLSKELEELW